MTGRSTAVRGSVLALAGLLLAGQAALGQDRVDAFVGKYDRDGDGRLSREEYPLPDLFPLADADGDGTVTPGEERAFRRNRTRTAPAPGEGNRRLPAPDLADVAYGPHPRNVLDLWKAPAAGPRPFVVYFHGGGFRRGDKSSLQPDLLRGLLDRGISVAAANYRLTDAAPFPAPMHDGARAVQFLRHRAAEFGLDPARAGATGGSAGSGISQWIAFHDDLARPDSEDPVARASTRLSAAVVYAAQTSYDPRFHRTLFRTTRIDPAMIPFYGMMRPEDVEDPRFHALFEEASPLTHLTADDPPVFYYYPQANTPLPPDAPGPAYIHHPRFGEVLRDKAEALGVPCVVRFREDFDGRVARGGPIEEYVAFFARHLLPEGRGGD